MIVYFNREKHIEDDKRDRRSQSGGGNDAGGYWWAIPGFLIPPTGIVLFFIMHRDKPISAKTALAGTGVGFVFYACYYLM